jgi:uncharacterized protein YqgV (UPF0045/DUF77 family)
MNNFNMKVSVEISYYPLQHAYISPIKAFIDCLNAYEKLLVKTNGMSTQVFGDYFDVMQALTTEIKNAFEVPHSVFVLKIVNADLNHVDGSK